jgi:hypothetical protein
MKLSLPVSSVIGRLADCSAAFTCRKRMASKLASLMATTDGISISRWSTSVPNSTPPSAG